MVRFGNGWGFAFTVGAVAMTLGIWHAHQLYAGEDTKDLDYQLPSAKAKLPFAKEQPIYFVATSNIAEWMQLKSYWNPAKEVVTDPITGQKVERSIVKIKVPLGFSQGPKIPAENPLTVERWKLGRDLYFDPILCSDATVSCASCHSPAKGFTDQSPVSTGISGNKGGVSAPTVMNAGYNALQFWDGRAATLEDQAQGPPQNALEMFDGNGNAWHEAIKRIRKMPEYRTRFLAAFGHEPTRDAAAMAIAGYERTVINANSIHDRAEWAMKVRVSEEGGVNAKLEAQDYAKALNDALAANDKTALDALNLKNAASVADLSKKLALGRDLFFGKARCTLCHTGENFTDSQFHNLGVGVKDGVLPKDAAGRYGALAIGAKNPEAFGAFKTPTVRGLLSTAPYMHDGSEKTLEQVVDYYDRGGNAHEFLDPKMRDVEAERAYLAAKATGGTYSGPQPKLFGKDQTPIIPFQLKLTPAEKQSLVLFMRALQGEVDALVTDPKLPIPTAAR